MLFLVNRCLSASIHLSIFIKYICGEADLHSTNILCADIQRFLSNPCNMLEPRVKQFSQMKGSLKYFKCL